MIVYVVESRVVDLYTCEQCSFPFVDHHMSFCSSVLLFPKVPLQCSTITSWGHQRWAWWLPHLLSQFALILLLIVFHSVHSFFLVFTRFAQSLSLSLHIKREGGSPTSPLRPSEEAHSDRYQVWQWNVVKSMWSCWKFQKTSNQQKVKYCIQYMCEAQKKNF